MARELTDPLISCVVPVFNEAGHIKRFLEALSQTLSAISKNYEIIVVDDGSEDGSVDQVLQLAEITQIRLLQFSRNFGKEAALSAGIDAVQGDATILIDSDFQHPLRLLPVMIDYWRQGHDVVYGLRETREGETFFKRVFSNMFYKIMRMSDGVKITPNSGDFRLMDRCVIDALRRLPERNRFMKGMYAWVGFDSIPVLFEADERPGGQAMSYRSLSKLALTGIISYSSFPLKLVGLAGIIVSLLSLIYGIYILFETLILGNDNPGWPTLVVIITFLSGIQLFALGVMGEYVSGIFTEVKQRPNYLIKRDVDFSQSMSQDVNELNKAS